MVFPNNNNRIQLEQCKTKLENLKAKADKAQIQEEYLTKQLQDDFEVETLEEAIELLDILIEEKKDYDNQIKIKTDEVISKMQKEGFI